MEENIADVQIQGIIEIDEEEIRKQAKEELGKTYYDVLDIPMEKEKVFDFIHFHFDHIDSMLGKIEEEKKSGSIDDARKSRLAAVEHRYRKIRDDLSRIHTNGDFEAAYEMLCTCKKAIISADRNFCIGLPSDIEEPAKAEFSNRSAMLHTITNNAKKKAYDVQITQTLNGIIERLSKEIDDHNMAYIQSEMPRLRQIESGILARSMEQRKKEAYRIAKEELDPDFFPTAEHVKLVTKSAKDAGKAERSTTSELNRKRGEGSEKKKDKARFGWKVLLYDKKIPFIKLKARPSSYKELDQEITINRYGAIQFNGIFPITADNTCEVLGIQRKDVQGNVEEDFVIAQTRGTFEQCSMTRSEIEEARKSGKTVLFVDANTDKVSQNHRSSKFKRAANALNGMIQGENAEEKMDVVVISNALRELTPNEQQSFVWPQCSEYVIDFAKKIGTRYIGTTTGKMEISQLDACIYAMNTSGILLTMNREEKPKRLPNLKVLLEAFEKAAKKEREEVKEDDNAKGSHVVPEDFEGQDL